MNKEEDKDELLQIITKVLEKYKLNSVKIDKYFNEVVPDALDESSRLILDELKSTASNMLIERREIQKGFKSRLKKVWGKAFDLLEMLIVIAEEVGNDFNKKFSLSAKKNNNFVFEALTRLHARACQIANEILALLKSGYADGANARWRTLHEIAVTSYFIEKYGNDTAERYIYHETVESFRAMQEYQQYCEKLNEKPFSQAEIDKLTSLKDDMLNRFGNNFKNKYGWASYALGIDDPNFKEIEKHTGIEHFRPYYKMSSYNIHATPKGIMFKLGLSPNVDILLTGPSNAGLADPGQSTAISLNQVTSALLLTKPNYDRILILKVMLFLVEEISEAFIVAHEYIEKETKHNLKKQNPP